MAVTGVWSIILCTGHRWCKTKEQNPWNNTKQIFPNSKQRSLFFYVICVQHTKFWLESGIHYYLDKLSIQLVKESVHLTVSLGISKTITLTTISQQAHACWELRNWSPSTWLVCRHLIQISTNQLMHCMGICFSCMYTNNYEHFHKWFGTFCGDNSVLMSVPDIQ